MLPYSQDARSFPLRNIIIHNKIAVLKTCVAGTCYRNFGWGRYWLVLLLWFLQPIDSRASEFPNLRIEAPPQLATLRAHLQSISSGGLADIAELLGVTDAGQDIQVVLAADNSSLAQGVAPWIAGFAVGESNL